MRLIAALDLSERAVWTAQSTVQAAGLSSRIQSVRGDCYHLGFQDASFDAVISFGYASAASYEGAAAARLRESYVRAV